MLWAACLIKTYSATRSDGKRALCHRGQARSGSSCGGAKDVRELFAQVFFLHLAHGIARAIETSDIIFHMPGIAPDILGLARRDATVIELESTGDDGNIDNDARERLKHQAAFFARQGSNITCLYRN